MNSTTILHGSYDYRLVALSIVLAAFASYAALDLAGRVTAARGRARAIWLSAGAAAMGLGVWAMHYVGMLALTTPMPVFYHLPTVALSLLAAIIAASGMALFVASRIKMSVWQAIAGSVVMGSGIAAMHYIGMAAMRGQAVIVYDRGIAALFVVLAIVISVVALQIAFRLRDEKSGIGRKIMSALVVGSAIPLMHCTGMWAATLRSSRDALDLTHAIGISTLGVVAISASSFLVLGIAIASSFFDRFMAQKGDLDPAREREFYFRTMAEAVPEIIFNADPDGMDDYFNQRCFDYTGLTLEQCRGTGWTTAVHPDDLALCMAKWENARRTGDAYDVEYRLRRKDGTFRWFLCRGNPIRNAAGDVVKWFGTCTDIENQKQNQQVLEEQILERTMQLADVNTRLQEEMSEKDSARRELDQQNERMMEELRKRSERATMLAKMGELLQSCIGLDEVVAAALGVSS